MSQTSKPQVDIEKEIMTAIDRCGSEGASLDDIQRYLKSTLKDNVPDLETIQSSLNTAVSKELLLKLENGKYKIKGSAERTEKDDEDDDDEEEDENEEDDDDDEEIMTVIDIFGPEGATLDDIQQYLESTLKNDVPDLESIQSRLNTAVDKELLELDNGKYKIKDYAELEEEEEDDDDDEDDNDEDDDDEENDDETEDDDEHCENCKKDKENAQKVGRSVDKVSQDPNRNADSDTQNAGSSKAKKDANIPIPDDRDKVLKRRLKKDK